MRTDATQLVAGVDEAGRGPLAGPVVVAAVILDPARPVEGLDDSKRLSPKKRETLFRHICDRALAYEIVLVGAADVDRLNILRATLWGMQLAIEGLPVMPGLALIDGNQAPALKCASRTIVQGDRLEASISAASILAKVRRDWLMQKIHADYPEYGFDRNKGYPTQQHLSLLKTHGPCPEHRRSFAPVRRALAQGVLPFPDTRIV